MNEEPEQDDAPVAGPCHHCNRFVLLPYKYFSPRGNPICYPCWEFLGTLPDRLKPASPANNRYPKADPVRIRFPRIATSGTKRVLVAEAIAEQNFCASCMATEYRLMLLASISDYLTDRDVEAFYSAVLKDHEPGMRLVAAPLVQHVMQDIQRIVGLMPQEGGNR